MSALDALLHARTGPMTSELVQHPGDFGLGRVPARLTPAGTAKSICGFCSTGCSLNIHLNAEGEAINLTPDPNYPVNLGMACPKGWEALTPLAANDRVTTPLLRDKNGVLQPIDWTRALEVFCEQLKGVQAKYGKSSVAVLSTGQIVTEEMALLGALAKFGMGLTDIDSNTRQCMATSHVAYKQSLGFDAPPFTYADFEESDVLVFVGANPCIAHPIMWQRVMRNQRNPAIIVIDPRRTETAMAATLHLPAYPKSDLTLLYGLSRELIARGAVDQAYVAQNTTGFTAFSDFVQAFTTERVLAETGLTHEDFIRTVDHIARPGARVSYWWTMGVNQSHQATRTAQALINLALMTGQFGKPGTGANSITGQCNAMGSRLFGNATSLIGGYDYASEAHRAHVGSILNIDPALIPQQASRAYDRILDAVHAGEIRALWIIATNTAHSWINQGHFTRLRDKLDFLVVQDMYATTETAQQADLILPAAGWGEKDGFFINSERRLGLARKVARAPGVALSDFAIFKLVAEAWGCGPMFEQWSSPSAAFQILKKLSSGLPCDFSGIRDHEHIQMSGGIQWPFTAADAAAEKMSNDELETSSAPSAATDSKPSTLDIRHSSSASASASEPSSVDRRPSTAATEFSTPGHRHSSAPSEPSTFDLRPATVSPEPSTFDPRHSTTTSQPSTLDLQPSTVSPEPSTFDTRHSSAASQPSPFDLRPSTAPSRPSTVTSERRLFSDGKFFTPDRRAKFLFDEPVAMPELPDADFPLLLNTGRGSSSQWHTGSRTNKSAVLRKLSPTQPWVELNPADATRLGLSAGELVIVRSRRGETIALAVVTPIVQPGQTFMPMHFAEVNVLTFPAYDPHSRQPSYKACAVTVVSLPASR